jgi:hypothetical protein
MLTYVAVIIGVLLIALAICCVLIWIEGRRLANLMDDDDGHGGI